MNIRKELYMSFYYEAERRAREAEKQLEHNKNQIKHLVSEQKRLKKVRDESYRVYAEMKGKVNTCSVSKKKV